MTEKSVEYLSLFRSRIQEIRDLTSIEDIPKNVIGLHGTSSFALLYYVEFGFIPGNTTNIGIEPQKPLPGDLYFTPVKSQWENNGKVDFQYFSSFDTVLDDGIFFANEVGHSHALLHSLGLSFSNDKLELLARKISVDYWILGVEGIEEELNEFIKISKKSKSDVMSAILQSMPHNGVLLSMSPNVMNDLSLRYGDKKDELRIQTYSKKLSNIVNGIYFQSVEEKSIFDTRVEQMGL